MPLSEKEYEYWGKRADMYEESSFCVVGHTLFREIEGWLTNQFVDTDMVLELGCGSGVFSGMIASKVKHLTAADLVPEMVEQTREKLSRYSNAEVQREDCYSTSFEDNRFDAVLMVNLLHIVKDPVAVLREGNRVLKDDGRAIIVDFTGYKMRFLAKVGLILRYCRKWGKPCPFNKNFNPAGLAEIAEKAGFMIEERKLIGKDTKAVCLVGEK
jgi:ubiquinone/menaquinone biosynthesis C-methylase UbiE